MKNMLSKEVFDKNQDLTKIKVCIIGPGVVGQATGKALIAKGVNTAFIGKSEDKVNKLRESGYEAFVWEEMINGNYDYDITMLTVPTPTRNGKIDLSAMKSSAKEIGKRLSLKTKYHLVVVKSTVLPGTTRNLVGKIIEEYSGKKPGEGFGLCMNPEYLREETAYEDTINPWIIVVGEYDKKSGDMLSGIYKNFESKLYRVSIEEAEMQKYMHNLFNAAKISFFNEMREVGKEMGVDIDKVFKLTAISSEGMWNPKYGIRDRGPFLGSCLPKDTQAFLSWAEENGYDADLLKTVIEVNEKIIERMGLTDLVYKTQHTL